MEGVIRPARARGQAQRCGCAGGCRTVVLQGACCDASLSVGNASFPTHDELRSSVVLQA